MAQDQNIDLFGNSTLTPRQIIQQQLAKSVSNTEALYKDAAPVNRAAAIWGSGLGGLFRQVLQEKGIIDKDPEVVKAEKMQAFRENADKRTKEAGVQFGTPDYYKMIAGIANEAGMPEIGLKALQFRDIEEAKARTTKLEQAKIDREQGGIALDIAKTGEAEANKTESLAKAKQAGRLNKNELLEEPQEDGRVRMFYMQNGVKNYVGASFDPELTNKEAGVSRRNDRGTELKLYDDFKEASKPFLKVKPIYQAQTEYLHGIITGKKQPTPPGDATMARAYLRMIDDRINVSDKKDVDQFQNVFGRVKQGIVNTLFEGKVLDDDVRKAIYDDIARNFDAYNEQQIKIEDDLVNTTVNYKLNPKNVVRTPYAVRKGEPRKDNELSQEDLEYTAKKHGITIDEVKKRLGQK